MLSTTLCVLAFTLSIPALALFPSDADGLRSFPLCRSLERTETGSLIPVVVAGIYAVNDLCAPEALVPAECSRKYLRRVLDGARSFAGV